MKAAELRIGNWIKGYHDPEDMGQVTAEHFSTVDPDGDIDGEGIPLTAEILEKAGFESDFDGEDYWYHEKMRTFAQEKFHIYLPYELWDSMAPCGYVHQLQNLYFALTGEELQIDLSK